MSTPPVFTAHKEHSLDMGTFVVEASVEDFDFAGSTAQLRIGRLGEAAWLEWETGDTLPEGGIFEWDDSTRELKIDLPASVFDAPAVGGYVYQITITSAADVRLAPPLTGPIRLGPVVQAPV